MSYSYGPFCHRLLTTKPPRYRRKMEFSSIGVRPPILRKPSRIYQKLRLLAIVVETRGNGADRVIAISVRQIVGQTSTAADPAIPSPTAAAVSTSIER